MRRVTENPVSGLRFSIALTFGFRYNIYSGAGKEAALTFMMKMRGTIDTMKKILDLITEEMEQAFADAGYEN